MFAVLHGLIYTLQLRICHNLPAELQALECCHFRAVFTDLGFQEDWQNTQNGKVSKHFARTIYEKKCLRKHSTSYHPEHFVLE